MSYRDLYQLRKELKWLKSYAKSPKTSQFKAYKMRGEIEEGKKKEQEMMNRLEFQRVMKKVLTNERH